MPIDTTREQPLPLQDVPELLKEMRPGSRAPHVNTVRRWATRGFAGVVLESVKIGATRCTSVEALHRFFARLTEATSQ